MVSSRVEEIRPPKIVMATGCRISLPGASAPIISGTSASPAESAVIRTGVNALEASAHDHLAAEPLALDQHEIDVVADLEDAVARTDAGKRDEADHGRHRKRLARDPKGRDAADQRQRHVAHDDQREHRRLIAAVEHDEDRRERHQSEEADQP